MKMFVACLLAMAGLLMCSEANAAGFRRGGQQIQAGPAGVQINQGGRRHLGFGGFHRGGQQIQVAGGGFGGAAFAVNPFFVGAVNPFVNPFAVGGCGFGAAQFQSFGVPAFGGASLQINQQRGLFGGIRSQQIQSSGGAFQLNQ